MHNLAPSAAQIDSASAKETLPEHWPHAFDSVKIPQLACQPEMGSSEQQRTKCFSLLSARAVLYWWRHFPLRPQAMYCLPPVGAAVGACVGSCVSSGVGAGPPPLQLPNWKLISSPKSWLYASAMVLPSNSSLYPAILDPQQRLFHTQQYRWD